MSDGRLYLVDASIYVFRAWFILPDSIRSAAGEPANAVHGYADFLYQLLSERRPVHLACCFDQSLTSSVRNRIYPAYKANRDPAPEELKRQFAWCREWTRALGIAEFASPSYEADDIIATLAAMARRHERNSVVVSGDKDLTQVVGDGDEWWDFGRDRRLDVKGVLKQWGVHPAQIADLLALTGDKVDNIPGVPGIGPATAARLLTRWQDVDGVFANLARVPAMKFRGAARVAALLAEHEATVRLARQLTVTLEVPDLPTQPEALTRRDADLAALNDLWDRLDVGAARRQRWLDLLTA